MTIFFFYQNGKYLPMWTTSKPVSVNMLEVAKLISSKFFETFIPVLNCTFRTNSEYYIEKTGNHDQEI